MLFVEILSPGIDRDDVFVKLPAYQRIRSLREILYVETGRVGATVYCRGEAGLAASGARTLTTQLPSASARRAVTSISIFIRGSTRPQTSAVAAGRIVPKTSPSTDTIAAQSAMSGT